MSKILRAVIVMRDAKDIELNQYVVFDGDKERVAKVTFDDGAIEHAFDHVARWFRDSIARIARERAERERAQQRDAEIAAGVNVILGHARSPIEQADALAGGESVDYLLTELLGLLREAASDMEVLPDAVRERVDGIAARIGATKLRKGA